MKNQQSCWFFFGKISVYKILEGKKKDGKVSQISTIKMMASPGSFMSKYLK